MKKYWLILLMMLAGNTYANPTYDATRGALQNILHYAAMVIIQIAHLKADILVIIRMCQQHHHVLTTMLR